MANKNIYDLPENSPLSIENESISSDSRQYSQMSEQDAESAFATRREQIKAALRVKKSPQKAKMQSSKTSNSFIVNASNHSAPETPKKAFSRRSSVNSIQKSSKKTPEKKFSSTPSTPRRDFSNQSLAISNKNQEANTSVSSIHLRQISLNQVSSSNVSFSKDIQNDFKRKMDQKITEPAVIEKYDTNEPLCERAVKWKLNAQNKWNEKKKENEDAEMKDCSFYPILNDKINFDNYQDEDIYTRQLKWKEQALLKNEENAIKKHMKELEGCTFRPKVHSKAKSPLKSLGVYMRNMKWKSQVESKVEKIEQQSFSHLSFEPKINISSKGRQSALGQYFHQDGLVKRYMKLDYQLNSISKRIEQALSDDPLY
ncbi:unnamed protein product [Blepharisma stoltei]|uniref:Uncharacterized protein n=1 Tax=Blepharisma stoltei TaxID=1481888 RepID=A0AAU9IUJ6_9CILI|nr:unnamed protein product [Blepharisma stoltei]